MFAGEPLIEVTAPIAEAQLVETVLLNQVTFQTSMATKAARCVLAADGAQLIDFSFRHTQGIEAGLAVARASAMTGFTATSNTEAARRYGLTARARWRTPMWRRSAARNRRSPPSQRTSRARRRSW